MIRIADIQRTVAKRYRVPVSSMTLARKRRHARPRQVAILLATRLTDHSLNRIGDFFGGRDHSTVIHSCRVVEERARRHWKLKNMLREVTLELMRG